MVNHCHRSQLFKLNTIRRVEFLFDYILYLQGFSISAPIASIPNRVNDTIATIGATSQPRESTSAKGKKKIYNTTACFLFFKKKKLKFLNMTKKIILTYK